MSSRFLGRLLVAAIGCVLLAVPPAEAIDVTRTSSDGSFLISTKFSTNNLGGMYASYRINNDDPSAYDDVWVTVDSFTGGVVGLGSGEDGIYKLGPLGVGETKTAYFYLTAASSSASAQSHTLHVFDRRPDLPGALEIHTEIFSFTDVDTSISASANKVDVVVSGPDPATIGGVITMQVEGRTGTVGAGSVVQFSPAGDNAWLATAFRLISADITFLEVQGNSCTTTPIVGGNFTEQLQVTWSQTSCYVAVYRFVASESTSQPTAVTPLIHVASGTQIKHTDPTGFAGLPPIQPPQNFVTLAKSVNPVSMMAGGNVTYTVTFANTAPASACPVSEPTCNDVTLQDIVDMLPTSPATATYVAGTSTFAASAIPDPSISGSILTWTGSFVVPAESTADLVYQVAVPGTNGAYANSVVAHVGTFQIDTTVSGVDNAPGQATVTVGENPSLGVAKNASVSGSGPFDVTLDFYLENFGDVALSNVQVTDDLDAAFGAGNYSVTTGPTIVADPGGGLTVNAGFNGAGDQDLLTAGSSSLGVGQTAQLRIVVSVTAPGSYTNSAVAGGDPPSGAGNRVTDDSVDGVDPDADNSGDPGNDTSDTPIDLAENPIIGVSKDASVSGSGPFDVTLDFYLENFGNVGLSNVQVTDDLDAAFGSGNYSVTTGPTIVADPGGGLTVNAGFNGAGDQDLLTAASSSLGIGQTAQLRIVVSVTAPGSYTNSAVAGGDPPSGAGNRVTDDSVDGVDPDADNSGDPGNDTGDTPIDLAENAIIGISKDASVSGTGPFDVTLDFYLENFGNVGLSNVQVTDDLDAAFGAGNYSVTTGPTIVADPGGGLTVNAGFNGAGDQDLLTAGSSSLGVGQTAQLRIVVSVTAPGSYTNSAVAGGDPPSGAGNRVTDDSVDGVDPDADNSGDPGNDTSDTPIDLAENPIIGVSKDASVSGSGPFDVTLDFYLENFGNVALSNVQVADDLDAAFGAGNYSVTTGPTIVADPGGGLTVNAGFNGAGDQDLLTAGSSSLGVGQTAQLRIVVSVTAPGSYTNSAVAGGDPPSGAGNRVTDDSVDGVDPDADNSGDPGNDTSDTPIDLTETPIIGVSKDASVSGSGPFDVTLDFYLENFGNVSLSNVQVTDDLDAAFGAGNYSVTTGPTIVADPGGGLTANAGFNGAGDQSLLNAATSSLGVGQTAQLRIVVSVTAPGSYTNSAVAGGDPPSGAGNRVTDDSVDGVDPDADNSGDPGNDTSDTPIDLTENPIIGVSKDASVSGSGPFDVTLDFYLENFGNVSLSNVQVTDDLDAAFGAGNYSVTTGPTIVADPGGGLTANAGFNGSGDQSLLNAATSSLGVGQTAQLRIVVSVTAPGSYTNSAVAGGDPPSGAGNRVTDDSVDGVDPDADNSGDPGNDTSDTPIDLAENPIIGVSKDASVSGSGPFDVTLDFYLENFGNVGLSNVQVTDDLDAAFGAGNYSVTTGPTIVADPGGGLAVNAGFNGADDPSLLNAATSTLGVGQTAQLRIVVSVTAPGSYTNSAVAGGDPPSGAGNRVTDDSVDGVDPDADNSGDPGNDTSDTPIDLTETPIIGVSKDASVSGSGPFDVTLDFYLENFGNVALSNVQVSDDLDAAFGAGNYSVTTGPTIVADPGGGLTVNAGFNGAGDQDLLTAGSSSLGVGQTAQLRIVVSVTAPGSYTNSAVAGGDPPSGAGNRVTDDSVDGVDPDADNSGDPGNDTSDTPIDLTETPIIGVSKDASVSGAGPFDVTLDFYLENFGNVSLSNVQMTDDLDAAFGAGNYSVTTGPTIVADPGGGLTVNAGFNGAGDQDLLTAGSSSLGIGQTAQLRIVVSVTAPGSYTNSAVAGGDPPSGAGNRVTDDSVDGVDPDADNSGDPGNDTSDTPIDLTETPIIGVSKDASVSGSGPFDVTLDFYLENFGNVALSNVQVTDDIDAAFGAGNYSVTTGPTIVADPGGGLTVNAGFNGAGDQSLLNAATSSLGVGQTAQLRIVVSVTAPGSYTNSAVAGGDPPSGAGNRVTDDSVDGVDPDADNSGDPGNDTSDTPIDLTENPIIGVSKDASVSGSGPFDVTLDFYLENFGNVSLSNVQVTDDLDAAFGAGNYSVTTGPTIVADPGGALTVNAGFNGAGDQSLLTAGSSSLGVGQTAQLRIVVSVTAPGIYTNSAVAGGDPPSGAGNRVTDDSVDGVDPDTDNSGDPGNDTSDTPIDLAETPVIGVSKDASVSGSGPFDVTLDFYLENFGNVALSNVQVTDDLDAAFGAGNYSFTTGPTIVADPGGGLTVNAGFNGAGDQDLLNAATSSLGVGQTAQLRIVVSVTAPGSYTNSAVAGGDPPSGAGNRVTDDSVDGVDPDADNSGDPGNDTSDTPIDLTETPIIGVSKDASVSGSGPFDVTLDFYLENFGNVALSNVQVTDDIDAAFGAGNYSVTTGPTIVADPGGGLTVNAGFNGAGDQSLLNAATSSLGVGQTAQLRIVVSVTAPGSYTNSAVAGGDPPSGAGNRVTDDSVDGVDPDADNSGDPGNDTSDTPIDLTENPIIGVSKDASVSGSGPFDVTLDFYLENFGNVSLSNVQVTDDLDAAFGAGNYSVTTGPTIVADPGGALTVNAGFNGAGDQSLLTAGSSSLGVGQTAQLRIVVSVTAPGIYTNSAVAGGDPPSGAGNRVTDDSVDGVDPDTDNSGDPGNDTSDTPIDLAETPVIGVSKDASVSGSGPFDVTLDFYLENFGNVALSNVQVTDDLDAAFGAGNYSFTTGPTIVADPGGGLTVNAGFNGAGDQDLLNAATSSLGVGQTAQLRIVVSVTAPGSYTNSAVAGGDPPSGAGNRVTDDSVDGVDPDADNSGDPGNDTSDTPIDLTETPIIGVSKDASVSGSGPFDVTLDFYLENFGNVALSNVQVTDDIDAAFGAGNYSVTTGPTIVADPGGGLTVNAGFNGAGDQSLLNAATSSLGVGQTAQLRIVVSVTAPGSYTNSAVAGGDPPSGAGNRVTDDSVDGVDPDADNSGDPGNDTSDTPIDLTENPIIGVSKDASVSGSGPFDVTLDFYLENFGNVSLSNVQVTDDLDAAFGAGNYSVTTGPTIVADPGGGLTANAGFNGAGDPSLLNAATSSLGVGQTAQLRIVVSVTAPGSYTNSAVAGGDPPSGAGNRVTDDSVDGVDPDADNSGDPGNDTSDTPIDLTENPIIGVSKDASVSGSGPFDVTLDFYLENFGNVSLSNVQVTDDLDAAFGAGNYSVTTGPTIVADPGGGLTANAGFNGSGDQSLLNAATSSLGVGQTAQLRIVVSVTAPGIYTNSAVAGGDPPSGAGNRVTDDSVDGVDPDTDNSGDPGNDTSDTPIDLAETPVIGVSKDASVSGSGPFDVTLDFYLENFGNVALSNVQVTDDLDAAFGAGNYSFTTGPTIVADPGGGLTVNAGFNGAGDQDLLNAATSSLGVGQTAQLRIVVSVTAPGSYTNSAVAGGDPPSGAGNRVTDDSVDGVDPDADNSGDPGNDTSDTPINLTETPIIGVSKDASVSGSGPFDVTLDFYLENFGNVALSNVQVTDDIDAAFGAGNYSVTTGPTIVADPGGGLTVNAGFNGAGDQSLLNAATSSLGVGQTAQLRIVVSVTAPGSYTNSAVAGGDPPSGAGNRVTDDSVDGVDPDADNSGDPGNDTSDTPIDLTENPIIGVSKDASVSGSGPFDVTLDFYLENFGNVSLSNVQVTDDLDAAFGAGNYSVTTGPTIVADPGGGLTVNAGFNGAGDQDLLTAGSSSLGVGQTAQLRILVSVTAPGSYTNSAVAGGDPPSGAGNRVTDDSVDGVDPDADNSGDPGNDTSDTPIDLTENPIIGVSKDASVSGSGPFDVTLDFYLENFGNVSLSNVQVTDDLDAAFGAGNYSVTTGPMIVADPGGGLTVNAGFNGAGDQNLLTAGSSSLGVGQTAQLRIFVSVTGPGSYTNSAVAEGDPPSGAAARVRDDSVAGVDPDADGDGDPGDDTAPTPIPVAGGSVVLAKVVEARSTTVGGLVAYTIDATNNSSLALVGIEIRDTIPAGFKYVPDSAVLTRAGMDTMFDTPDDVVVAIGTVGDRPILFDAIDFAGAETVRLRYLLQVGSGVSAGNHVNVAEPLQGGVPIGNQATASIEVVDDVLFDRTTIIGKVFHDRDGDGWQDPAKATDVRVEFLRGTESLVPLLAEIAGEAARFDSGVIFVGEISGRADRTVPIEASSVLLSARFDGVRPDRVRLTTGEGSDVLLSLDGSPFEDRSRERAREETSQSLSVEPQESTDPTMLTLSVVNRGLDEPGIPGVRVVTTEGLLIETDRHGRYHLADVDGGRWERGRNVILKVDGATLPSGSRFTTENPRVLRITRGLMSRIDFGVELPEQPEPPADRVERASATIGFAAETDSIAAAERGVLQRIAEQLDGREVESLELRTFTEPPKPQIVTEQRAYTLTPHFPPLGVELSAPDRADLDRVIDDWRGADEVHIEVHGHTSNVRIAARSRHLFADNYALSRARAQTVANYLQQGLGLSTDRVVANGHGPDMPVADNDTAEGRAANRRTELSIRGTFRQVEEGRRPDNGRQLADRRARVVADALESGGVEALAVSTEWAGESDEPRVEVRGTYRVRTPAGGVVWATEDPALAEPALNVIAPVEVDGVDGQPSSAVPFAIYINYADFVSSWELRLSSDRHNTAESFVAVSGDGAPPDRIEWDGVRPLHPEAGAETWAYRLRVYDEEGRFDETRPRSLAVVPGASSTIDDPAAEVHGVGNLGRRGIPVSGSRVRIHGTSFEPQTELTVDGRAVPVGSDGTFAVETIKPVGSHEIDVAGEGPVDWARGVPVEVRGDYFFMVGIADLTVGQNNLSGNLQPLAGDEHYDGDVFVDGRVALYLKGKVKGRYLVTARVDTGEDALDELFDNLDEEDPRRLFRHLDPDRYYPVYGDDSTTLEDAPSQGKLYVRLDWDESSAVWGNYATGFTGTEFAQYNRTLYGARVEHHSPAKTGTGEDRLQVKAFASPAQTLSGHNRFAATGGSLYYLRDTEIVYGSEKIATEIIDRDSGRVVERVELMRGRDYEIDELQGRIILTRPLSQVASQVAPSIVKDRPLDGNRVFLLVDYEYLPSGLASGDTSFGVRGQGWATDKVSVGGTWVEEDRAGQDYRLSGADLVLRQSPGTYVKLEYAESEAGQSSGGWVSSDGGLTFLAQSAGTGTREGEAYGIEARAELGALTGGDSETEVAAWYRHRSAGFSSARIDTGIETDEYGAEATWSTGERLSFAARGAVVDQEGLRTDTSVGFQARYRLDDTWSLAGEARHVREETPLADGHGTLAALRADYRLSDRVQLFGQAQATVSSDAGYADNDLISLGSRLRLGDAFSATAEISTGDRGDALRLGAEHRLSEAYQLYGTYTLSTDRTEALRDGWTIGQRAVISDQLTVFTENQFAHSSTQAGLARVFGVTFRPDDRWHAGLSVQTSSLDQMTGPDVERDVVSVSVGHAGTRTRWSSKLEFRDEGGGVDRTQWLTTNRVDHRVDDSLSLFGKLSLSFVDDDLLGRDDARFMESSLGVAYRPTADDRWNLLGRYTYLLDLPTGGQLPLRTDQRSHVFSTDAIWRVTRRWELGGKLARREGEMRADRDAGAWFGTDASLVAFRARYHLVHQWDGLAEYRRLWSDEAEDSKAGFLVGVDRPLRDNLRIGVGYNFTDFTDDLTDLDYDGSGWFLNLVGSY